MLTSKQILDLLSRPPGRGGIDGHVEALRRGVGVRPGTMSADITVAQQRLLNDAAHLKVPAGPPKYVHPGTVAQAEPRTEPTLSPAEIAWLNTLPTDPAQVSFADAKALAGLSIALQRTPSPSRVDQRLVEAKWAPVRELHDRNAAQIAVQHAQQALPPIPSTALGALADAVANETTELRPEEVITRASDMLNEVAQKRVGAHSHQLYQAQANLDAVNAQAVARTATTAPTGGTR